MEMKGEQRIPAPRERVWAALNDADILRQCIPGCETLEKLSDTQMRATAKIKVGPVTARFAGEVTLSDLDPPHGYRITGEGQGGVAGFARGGATVRLEADGAETILHYTVDAQVGGKLAQLGGRLIDATAQQMAGLFFKKFAAALAPEQPVETVAASVPASTHPAVIAPKPAPASGRPSWLAPGIAIIALALLAWKLFAGNPVQPITPPIASDAGILVLVLVTLAGAVGYLFGERAR